MLLKEPSPPLIINLIPQLGCGIGKPPKPPLLKTIWKESYNIRPPIRGLDFIDSSPGIAGEVSPRSPRLLSSPGEGTHEAPNKAQNQG